MYQRFSDGLNSEWSLRLLPLWVCFLWIAVGPFLSLYRVGLLSSFYLEAASLTGALVLALWTACSGLLNVRLPSAAIAFLILAAFWWIQARVMNLTYPGMSDMVVWTFVILALAAWACRGWVAEYGQERIVTVLAWALLIGASLQAAVAVMQFSGIAGWPVFKGILAYGGSGNISGQLGQRNHLGHYIMWGVLAAAYLWAVRRLPDWAGALWVVLLAVALSLVNSRTILTYLMGVGVLLPLWYWRAGRESRRMVLIMLFALAIVAVCQFSAATALSWFSDSHYETAVERTANSGFQGSARDVEWRKAWLAFQAAPWFGHGWNGYALQGFLIHAQTHTFSNNNLGVLFTHAHNIVLQLLAEMGLVGTLLVAACYLCAIWRMLLRPYHAASLLLIALMTVSLCHSMLEYPLWYIYFLTPFALMLSLSPARYEDVSDGLAQAKRRNYAGGILALCLLGGMAYLGWAYTELTDYNRQPKTDSAADIARKTAGLRRIAADVPMLRYYAELSLTRRTDPTDAQVQPWAEQAALDALTYRPYANAQQVGLYLYRKGETERGTQWMQAMYYYYPYQMPFYTGKVRKQSAFAPLLPKLLSDCRAFASAPNHPSAKSCDSGN
ncbi:O-antigen ligase [Neisseria perflava]|uniref:PglL family O-oligosaccharyltransferase n=1 Tax=Neisseria perflava TaxID=33053 RepID=UPI00209CCCD2|nr:PglL family O-oligosaccharyltransferase [Neisseria perflava]MCP1773350.1 O-antigen ligase [Neisseria perflava]